MAKDLTHIKVKGTVHLWQKYGTEFKSLTNEPNLLMIEELQGFDFQEFIELVCENNEWNNIEDVPDGFFFIDHSTKTGNFIESDSWTPKIEKELRMRKYIQ